MANNLKRLASQRSDLFDSKGEPILSDEEIARRKKASLNYELISDNKESIKFAQAQNVNVEEQIRQIHEKFGK